MLRKVREMALLVGLALAMPMVADHALTAAHAQEGMPEAGADYWDIGFPEFQADIPTAISVPGADGALPYYWYWTFRFTATTNLHKGLVFLEQNVEKLEDDRERSFTEKQAEVIRQKLAAIKMPRAFVALMTDKGQILYDTSSEPVRNLVERKLGKTLLTVQELGKEPFETGRVYEAVAVFPDFGSDVNTMTMRVIGLGNRLRPTYRPGELLYTEAKARTSIRKELRYTYRRIGSAEEPYLTPVREEAKESVWSWMWPTQIFPGRYRLIDVERASGLKRTYAYVPYKVWNNTGRDRSLDVLKAGIDARVSWRGQALSVGMLDVCEDDSWKTSVVDTVRQRAQDGTESSFVDRYEIVRIDNAGDAVREAMAKDRQRKGDIAPTGGQRNVAGTIAPGKMVSGVMVFEWGIQDITVVANDLIALLREQAYTGGKDTPLYAEYAKIRKVNAGAPVHMQGAEPSTDEVKALLVKLASDDLQAKGVEVTEDDKRRYGDLAPLGALLNALAKDIVTKRADGDPEAQTQGQKQGGFTDVLFEVKTDGMVDRAKFPALFKRALPEEWSPLQKPDVALDGTDKAEGAAAGEEKKEEKKKAEEFAPW